MGTIVTNKTDWVGTKAQYLTTFPNGTDRRCYITDLSAYSITGADMILALTTQKAFYVVNDIFVCSESSSDGVYELGHTYQYKGTSWQDITPSQSASVSEELTLLASGWDATEKTQTISVVTNNSDRNEIDVSANSVSDWAAAGVYALATTDSDYTTGTSNSITFKCSTIPTSDLKFRVFSMGVNVV